MRTFALVAGLIALTPCLASASRTAPPSESAALAILAASKQASGGAAWDKIRGWRERGVHDDIAYETELNFRSYGTVFRNTRHGETTRRGYNGRVTWDERADGQVTISSDPARLAQARQSAYGSTYAWFLPQRFPAKFEYLGSVSSGAATYDAIRISPLGATPMDIWVDRASHLVTKLIDRSGSAPITASMSDFRDIDGLQINFTVTVDDGDPKHLHVGYVKDVSLKPPTIATAFNPPAQK